MLPKFDLPFELHCDACKLGVGAMLSQQSFPMSFFSENLSRSRTRYITYDVEFYAVVQAIKHWRHYIDSQVKVTSRHASWIAYLQQFTFSIHVN